MHDVRHNQRPSTGPEDAAGVPAFRSRPRWIKVAASVAASAAVVGVGVAVARAVRHWFIKPAPDGLIETVCIRRASLDVGAEVLPKATITEDLDVSTYEVTVDAYLACVRAGACESTQSNPLHGGEERRALCNETIPARGRHPINCVTLENARAFCGWVGMRVPTDVEWDYLACGNDGRPFPWGYTHPKDGALANRPLLPGESGDPPKGTMPVGSYPNGKGWAGLFDLGGNVSEWTVTAACGTKNCREESPWYIKGGSWVSASDLACGSRASYSMGSDDAGVRCVRTTQAHAGCLDPPMGPLGPSNVHFAAAGPVVQVPGGDFDMGSDLEELSRPVAVRSIESHRQADGVIALSRSGYQGDASESPFAQLLRLGGRFDEIAVRIDVAFPPGDWPLGSRVDVSGEDSPAKMIAGRFGIDNRGNRRELHELRHPLGHIRYPPGNPSPRLVDLHQNRPKHLGIIGALIEPREIRRHDSARR